MKRKILHNSLISAITLTSLFSGGTTLPVKAATPQDARTIECDLFVAGGGFSGAAVAYEGLLAGKTVCMTEITDWVGGQISSQGVSALDERKTQRDRLFFPRGYNVFRERIKAFYGRLNPGDCWVSESCFLPKDGHQLLWQMLKEAETQGKGNLQWFPHTVVKNMTMTPAANANAISGKQITAVAAIQHSPQPNTPPLNSEPLSKIIEDAYSYSDSRRLRKSAIRFVPKRSNTPRTAAAWYVFDATETGELIGLADVPYRLGTDGRSATEPSASQPNGDPYCTQGFTYTFAMETTATPQPQTPPPFYDRYAPYYSYELKRLADFGLVYTYRRIWSPGEGAAMKFGGISYSAPTPGDISMQNWTWGNDYRPGGSDENLILTRAQLQSGGQLSGDNWQGGLRPSTLERGEEIARGFYYWLVAGTTDSQASSDRTSANFWEKIPVPNQRYLQGLNSPMGTVHGLSKYPYIRESRRIIGRPSLGYTSGFTVEEIDITRNNLLAPNRLSNLTPEQQQRLRNGLSGTQLFDSMAGNPNVPQRNRATVYSDSIGIGHYAIDFHPCMQKSPPELPGNTDRAGERDGAGAAYPFQIPLRALIPQRIDNLLIAGKGIATSHVAAAAYRVHSFEWSVGAGAAATAIYALEKNIFPYQLVDDLPRAEPQLGELQKRLESQNNYTAFPGTSIFNSNWQDWQ
jgi:hypothetical protein